MNQPATRPQPETYTATVRFRVYPDGEIETISAHLDDGDADLERFGAATAAANFAEAAMQAYGEMCAVDDRADAAMQRAELRQCAAEDRYDAMRGY